MRGRPQLPIGQYGVITTTARADGKHQAICRFRDFDGITRRVTATGKSKSAASQALKLKLDDRKQLGTGEITPETKFKVLAEEWYADKLTEGLAYRTTERHRQALDTYILGALGELRLREATTGRLDRFIRVIGKNIGGPTANIVKGILSGIMGMAARYDAVPSNPVTDVHVHKVESHPIRALSLDEFKAMRLHAEEQLAPRSAEQRLTKTGDIRRMGGRNRSDVMLDIIDILIATGIRPGEVLAIRKSKLNLDAEIPDVRIDSTIIRMKGQGLVIQEHTKAKDVRRLALPQFAVDVLTRTLQDHEPNEWDVVFTSSVGTLMDPRNLGHAWTKTFAKSEFDWVTPKTLRKTVATLIDAEHGSIKAAKQLGHTSDEMTKKHYIEPSRDAVDQRQTLSQFRAS